MAITTTNEKLALISYQFIWNTPIPISADGLGVGDKFHLVAQYPWGSIVVTIPELIAFSSTVLTLLGLDSTAMTILEKDSTVCTLLALESLRDG